MTNYPTASKSTVVSTSMTPLPAPLWVEGKNDNGDYVRGVAFAVRHNHCKPKHPDLAAGTCWDVEDGFYEFVVLADDGQILELHTDCAKVMRRHDGDVYTHYLNGRPQ